MNRGFRESGGLPMSASVKGVARAALIAVAVAAIVATTGLRISQLRQRASEQRATAALVEHMRIDAVRAENVALQSLVENGPDFTLQSETAALSRRVGEQARRLAASGEDREAVARVGSLVPVFRTGLGEVQAALRARASRRAQRAFNDHVHSTSELLRNQPVVTLPDRRVVALEALLRWERADGELIGPDRFIALAEESGLIAPIGRWVLHEACAALAGWQRDAPGLRMAVNVSSVQLADPDLLGDVQSAIARAGIRPCELTLELTESALAAGDAGRRLSALRDLGVQIAVDDFGTGYSSLGYLRRLEIDCVKIDRSFVAGVTERGQDAALVRSIVELAHALELEVVAEGIETPGQAEMLRKSGCGLGQGFLFATPQPAPSVSLRLDAARAAIMTA